MAEFFIEIGCEEIPALMIPESLEEGRKILTARLGETHLSIDRIGAYASPTRLVYAIPSLDEREPDRTVRMQGPPRRICFNEDGSPGKALEGFLKKAGLTLDQITFEPGKKDDMAVADVNVSGRSAREILEEILPVLFKRIPFRKNMKWGKRDERFVRPVRWICALLDGKPVNLSFAGVQAGNITQGHRILGKTDIPVNSFADYRKKLADNHIVLDPTERRQRIIKAIEAFESRHNAMVIRDDALLDEVTFLVETPLVVEGTFDPKFLDIPEEVLITSMKEHQKYFAARDKRGNLLNRFLAVASMVDDPAGHIQVGNERVLAARLYDAQFFWNEDRKHPLINRLDRLARQIFQNDLGTVTDKIDRMKKIAGIFLEEVGGNADPVLETVELSKCDLATDMVYEFPELQGIMGGLYAAGEGKPEGVWKGIYDHYLPASMEDQLPRTREGELAAITDKLDTFLGCLAVGIIPTGSKDPFGLRRAAQGVVRIVLEKELDLDLYGRVRTAMDLYKDVRKLDASEWESQVFSILDARLSFWLQQKGLAYDEIDAVLAIDHGNLLDTYNRAKALKAARGNADFLRVATAFKRITNILASDADQNQQTVDANLLIEEQEKHLFRELEKLDQRVRQLAASKEYGQALEAIAEVADPVDAFFDHVLVMDKDEKRRRNRLALLGNLKRVFRMVADFSRLVISDA